MFIYLYSLGTGLFGSYYDDTTLTTLVAQRLDSNVNFNLGGGMFFLFFLSLFYFSFFFYFVFFYSFIINISFSGAPANMPGLGVDNFSIRWTGHVAARCTGTYTFSTVSGLALSLLPPPLPLSPSLSLLSYTHLYLSHKTDDGVRLHVGGVKIIDNWTGHSSITNTGTISLTANGVYSIVVCTLLLSSPLLSYLFFV